MVSFLNVDECPIFIGKIAVFGIEKKNVFENLFFYKHPHMYIQSKAIQITLGEYSHGELYT